MIFESQPLILKEDTVQRIIQCKRLRFALSKFCLRKTSFTAETLDVMQLKKSGWYE